MKACAAFSAAGAGHALASVDCHIDGAVAAAYGRLFGTGGAFQLALTALLTVYVGFIALGLMTGRTRLSLGALTPRVLAIGLVLTFATSWPAYQATIYGVLVGGPEEIVRALAGPGAGAHAFATRLDALFDRFADIAKVLGDATPGSSRALGPLAGPQMASALVWLSGILLLLATAGALVLTRIMLALLLALGPVFVVLALFRPTRGLFEGWLRTAVMFAVAPLLTVLSGSGAVALLAPLVDAIADDPGAAVADLRPVLELFMGAVVYVGLTGMLLWTCGGLVREWRMFGTSSARSTEPGAAAALAPAMASAGPAAASETRVAQIAAALGRSPTAEVSASTFRTLQTATVRLEPAAATVTPAAPPRARGLGQRFRPDAAPLSPPASGVIK